MHEVVLELKLIWSEKYELWMCHLLCVLNEDKWSLCKFWWSTVIRLCDLTFHEEGWVMHLQYFGYVVLISLLFEDVISSTVMRHLRFANSLSEHNPISAIWCISSFILNGTILSFDDLCYSSPGMWVHKCTTCIENAVLLFPFQVNPWRMRGVEYICYIGQFREFTALHKYSHCSTGYVMCFCCSTQEGFYVNIHAVIVKMGKV
jgi:hypothetical protein